MIVWLTSFPKSGNTWVKLFLISYIRDSRVSIHEDSLNDETISSGSRTLIDETICLDSTELTDDEIDAYRPSVYLHLSRSTSRLLLMKCHDAYTYIDAAQTTPLIPVAAIDKLIYIVRNPLDVAISFSHYMNTSIDRAVRLMGNKTLRLSATGYTMVKSFQVRQRLLSWSDHVLSWIDLKEVPLLVVRYEDLLARPSELFGEIVQFVFEEKEESRLQRAISNSNFDTLRQQELESGFIDNLPNAPGPFFRNGRAGTWREQLAQDHVDRVIQDHREVMERLNYI